MSLADYEFKKVRIICNSGNVYSGIAQDYTEPFDNENGMASICIEDNTELYENEIKSIEVITIRGRFSDCNTVGAIHESPEKILQKLTSTG